MRVRKFDIAIAGGGLAGCLTALALARLRPELSVAVVERGKHFGGNHLWSFFGSDVDEGHRWLVAPLVCQGWSNHVVHFPEYSRQIDQSYYSIESERLDFVVRDALPAEHLLTGKKILACGPDKMVLDDGTRIEAGAIIDARGAPDFSEFDCGWQKFVGRLVELDEPHGLRRPIIMDARVAQRDGYRFVYALPFTPTRLFVEDTYYSDDSTLDPATLGSNIAEYLGRSGHKAIRILRDEHGVLPVVKRGRHADLWKQGGEKLPKIGVRGGFFHPLTSYTLPDAVRVAVAIGSFDDLRAEPLCNALQKMGAQHWDRGAFLRKLAAMLFEAAEPDERYRVMQRFYRLPRGLIERFYAGNETVSDRVRILTGKPPVPVGRAMKVLLAKNPNNGKGEE